MAFKDKMSEVMLYDKRRTREIPSGVARRDCFFCAGDSSFVVIGQRAGCDFGGYVQRGVCQRADCILQAIMDVKEKTGL